MDSAPDWFADPATQVALDIHGIDGALDHIRTIVNTTPYLAGAYRDDFAEIAAEFQRLAAQ